MAFLESLITGLFIYRIEGTEPKIVELEEPIKIIGMTVDTDSKGAFRDIAQLGKRFEAYKRQHKVPNKMEPWGFAAVSQDYDERTSAFSYTMGDVVESLERITPGLTGLEIPAGAYAVFPVRPKNRLGWGMAIGNAKSYAYHVWLPNSGYEAAGTIDDLEYHGDRSRRKKDPEIDLYVAIKPRVVS